MLIKVIFDIVTCIVTLFFIFYNFALHLLITRKIIKSEMHSNLYNSPHSYFFLSTEDTWTPVKCRIIGPLVELQLTLGISKSKGPSETLRDIRTSTYQMCRTEENTNRTIKVLK